MNRSVVKRLYLMRLSTTTLMVGPGRDLELSSGCYLVETANGQRILIDSGMPWDAANAVPEGTPEARAKKNVLQHLAELKLDPEDIDMVICTHFDVDHAGYHDSFLNAEFVVQREHYELARSGNARYSGARKHWDNPRLKYRMVEGDVELLPGLELLRTDGHCFGHQSVLVRLPKSGGVLLAIDAVVLKRLFTVERKAGPFDENAEQLRASTAKLLKVEEREKVGLVVFGHDGEQWAELRRAPEFYE